MNTLRKCLAALIGPPECSLQESVRTTAMTIVALVLMIAAIGAVAA